MSQDLRDLNAFVLVAQEGSFTREAARLRVSQSALSQTLRGLEQRLGVRLLSRTTRSVAPTEAGARLLARIRPALQEIDDGLAQLTELRERPAGTISISADEFAVHHVLWPALERFLPRYPDIHVEIAIDYGRVDIVSARHDAGVRRGRLVSRDMVSVPISDDIRMVVVGAPAYWRTHAKPAAPQDLRGARGVAPDVRALSPLLSRSAPRVARVRAPGGRAALQEVTQGRRVIRSGRCR